jgi:hypothetical protein
MFSGAPAFEFSGEFGLRNAFGSQHGVELCGRFLQRLLLWGGTLSPCRNEVANRVAVAGNRNRRVAVQ